MSETDAERIRRGFKIPVDCIKPGTYWIIALDQESFVPTDKELLQIRSYCEFIVRRFYNETWQRNILEKALLPKCSGHNTVIFRNGLRPSASRPQRDPGEWFYRRASWDRGPVYVPSVFDEQYRPHTLVEIMDMTRRDVAPDPWEAWKRGHADLFGG